jgi:hypothetical protein
VDAHGLAESLPRPRGYGSSPPLLLLAPAKYPLWGVRSYHRMRQPAVVLVSAGFRLLARVMSYFHIGIGIDMYIVGYFPAWLDGKGSFLLFRLFLRGSKTWFWEGTTCRRGVGTYRVSNFCSIARLPIFNPSSLRLSGPVTMTLSPANLPPKSTGRTSQLNQQTLSSQYLGSSHQNQSQEPLKHAMFLHDADRSTCICCRHA